MNIRISWPLLGLAALFAAAVVAAVLELGPPTSSARTTHELVTAERGIVQSTVSGTGNVEAGTDVEANFQTSGTLQHIYVKDGDHVIKGQLLATLDPKAAQLTLDQAEENLASAQDALTNAQEQSTSTTSSSSTQTSGAVTTAAQFVSLTVSQTTRSATTPTTTAPSTTTTRSTPSPSTTTQSTTTPATTTRPTQTTTTGSSSSGSSGSGTSGSGSSGSGSSGSSSSGGTATTSAASRAASIASAEASVDSAEASVTQAENALHETHLYAPASGTVVNVEAISPGDQVSSSGSSSSSSGSTSSSSGSSSGTGSGASAAGSLGGSSSTSSSGTSSSSSSGLIEIVNTAKMTMTVAFSESDISKIKVNQPATVTMEALTGVELAAHVSAISTLGTSSSGVVSYDATLTLDQRDSRVKPGMSASAAVITGQASGVTLPNAAVSGTSGSVAHIDVMQNGKPVSTGVVVGVVGDNRTQIVSGLKAGQQVQVTETLPSLTSSGSTGSSSSSSGTLGGTTGRFGGAGGFAGPGGGFGGAGGFSRGG